MCTQISSNISRIITAKHSLKQRQESYDTRRLTNGTVFWLNEKYSEKMSSQFNMLKSTRVESFEIRIHWYWCFLLLCFALFMQYYCWMNKMWILLLCKMVGITNIFFIFEQKVSYFMLCVTKDFFWKMSSNCSLFRRNLWKKFSVWTESNINKRGKNGNETGFFLASKETLENKNS